MTREPGIYSDVSEADYHGDRLSLSSSGARKILPPSTPAAFRHEQLYGRDQHDYFDIGHAFHSLVLGVGASIHEVAADNWLTKLAKAERAAAYGRGEIPLLTHEVRQVQAMAEQVWGHPTAAAAFEDGQPEQSIYWVDPPTGVVLRARPDWMRRIADDRLLIVDLKSAVSAAPRDFATSCGKFGYYMQQPFYVDGCRAVGLDDNPLFIFVVVEKKPPYQVGIYEIDPADIAAGHRRNRQAIDLYAECAATDTWPGWGNEIRRITMPRWVHYQDEETS